MIVNNLIQDFNNMCIIYCAFVFALCFLRILIFHRVSNKRLQRVHVDKPVTSKPYYFYYCKNGRKDRVIKRLEVSEKIFNNYYKFHDDGDVIHVGKNTIWLHCK